MDIIKRLKSILKFDSVDTIPAQQLSPHEKLEDGYSWIADWQTILGDDWEKWKSLCAKEEHGPKVLIATATGGNSALTPFETVLAVALTLRGAEVHFMLCDKVLPACQNSSADVQDQTDFLANGPSMCDWCFECGTKSLKQLGLPVHNLSDFLNPVDRTECAAKATTCSLEQILNSSENGIELKEIIQSAAFRYFARGDLDGEVNCLPVVRKYYEAAMLSIRALTRMMEQFKFDHVISNQGLYVPQGAVVSIANKFGAHLSAWDLAYRSGCVHFTHEKTHIKAFAEEQVAEWEDIDWNDDTKSDIKKYLTSRWSGQFDWLKIVTEGAQTPPVEIAKELNIDLDKPVLGLLTNVIWDGQLCYPNSAFKNQIDWLIKTVNYFKTRPDLQLLIRVHPAELHGWLRSRQLAIEEINNHCAPLTKNVFIIPPESPINTYKAMLLCDAVTIYGTTAGLELSCMKIPVIVAGEAWIRGKGFSIDIDSIEEYFETLSKLPFRVQLSEDKYDRALKYAFHCYMRQMIPLNIVEPTGYENAPYKIKQLPLKAFDEYADEGLDIICNGILKKSPFIFPYEKHSPAFLRSN